MKTEILTNWPLASDTETPRIFVAVAAFWTEPSQMAAWILHHAILDAMKRSGVEAKSWGSMTVPGVYLVCAWEVKDKIEAMRVLSEQVTVLLPEINTCFIGSCNTTDGQWRLEWPRGSDFDFGFFFSEENMKAPLEYARRGRGGAPEGGLSGGSPTGV